MIKRAEVEKVLQNKIFNATEGWLENYSPELKDFRILGDLVLKTYNNLEGNLEELIIAHLEHWKSNVNLAMILRDNFKYSPLFNEMNFLGKLKACQKYELLNKSNDKKLITLLNKINNARNQFAHYQSYIAQLHKEYDTSSKRVSLLKELLEALNMIKIKARRTFTKTLA